MKPVVLNKKKIPGGKIPPGSVYIGRPSKWGNPFVLKDGESREECLRKYEAWLTSRPDLVADVKRELRGKSLVCFCAPELCHGDVLIRIANEEGEAI